MKIEIIDGNLYQWDTGRQVRLIPDPDESVVEVHFCCPCDPVAQVVLPGEDNTADIPNELLQAAGWLQVYVVTTTDTPGKRTLYHTKDRIRARKKPADYVYTETERRTWEGLDKRIGELEENQIDPDSVIPRRQLAADADAVTLLMEIGLVVPAMADGNAIYTDNYGNLFVL